MDVELKEFLQEFFTAINRRFDELDEWRASIDERMTDLAKGQSGIEQRLESIESTLGMIQGNVAQNKKDISDIMKHVGMD